MRELPLPSNMPDESPTVTGINPADIRLAAMNLLARREHSLFELRSKLRRRFPDEATVEAQLSQLAGEGLQSDVRFAESYARQRIGRGYGPVRLREELRERGVSAVDMSAALEALDLDWRAIAAEVLHKKFGSNEAVDIKEQARRARFMQYRGFTPEHYQQRRSD